MEIIEIGTESLHYAGERDLRNRILMRPIGLADGAREANDHLCQHIVAVQNKEVVGCVLLCPSEGGGSDQRECRARLIQMAVAEGLQGQGVGTQLVAALLRIANERGFSSIFCHSRADAVGFYAKLGFQAYGEPFIEVGIEHQKMQICTNPGKPSH